MKISLFGKFRYFFLFSFIMTIIFSVGFNSFLYGEQDKVRPNTFKLQNLEKELGLHYNGSLVSLINETMTPIEIRYTESIKEILSNSGDVSIEVSSVAGLAQDKEVYQLVDNGSYFTGTFPRVLIDDSQTPTPDNGIVEHYVVDTIVATYRNPSSPSDTLQVKVPFQITGSISINAGYYFDNNADGFVDSIFVEAATDIPGGLTNHHVQEILDSAIIFPAFRCFTINSFDVVSGGFYFDVSEDNLSPTTYVTSEDKFTVKRHVLSIGGLLKDTIAPIYDKVAPLIHWASNSVYLIDIGIDTISDTLSVKFSEPIEYVTHEEPFYFLDASQDTSYTVLLSPVSQPNPDSMVFFIIAFSGVIRMEEGDYVWIHETGRVGDTVSNYQNNPMNPRRTISTSSTQIDHNSSFTVNNINFHITKSTSKQYILRVSNLPHHGTVNIYTINGRRILQKQLPKGDSCLLLPKALSKTMYLMCLESGEHIIRKKLLLK